MEHSIKAVFCLALILAVITAYPSRVYAKAEEDSNTVTQEPTSSDDEEIHIPPGVPADIAYKYYLHDSYDIVKTRYNSESASSLDVTKPCRLTKEDFVETLENLPYDYIGFFERNAEFIYEMQEEYHIDGIFVCGIIAIESGWGECQANTNNVGGLRGSSGWMYFESEEACIECIFSTVASYGSTTPYSIGLTYCGENWGGEVLSAMRLIINSAN